MPVGTYTVKAVAYDNSGASASSATVTVTVSSAANKPPTVTLTSPASGATFTAPATVTSSVPNATDSDGTVARVEFYNGTTLLNSDTAAPYSFTWSSVPYFGGHLHGEGGCLRQQRREHHVYVNSVTCRRRPTNLRQ